MLYADDRNAGKIIDFVCSWYPHAKRRRKGTQGVWSVFSRQELCEGTRLTPKQYRNAMPVAVECGAVDFVIGGHAGKKAIFTRPTAALTRYLRDATDRRAAHLLRPKGRDAGRDGGRDPIQPSLSFQSIQKKDEANASKGKGRAADRLPPGQPEPASPGPLVEPERLPPPGETALLRTGLDNVLSMVRAAKASGLDEAELRAELVRLLPPAPRNYEHGVWHPSEKYPAWSGWSPEKLVEKQDLYEQYVENWYRAHPDAARRAAEPVMTDEQAIAYGYHVESEEVLRRREEMFKEMKSMTFEEWEDGDDIA